MTAFRGWRAAKRLLHARWRGGGATGFYNFELIACHRPRDISFSAALTTVGTTWEPPPPTTTSRHRSFSVRSTAHLYISAVHSTRTRAINIYYNDVLYGGAHVCKRFLREAIAAAAAAAGLRHTSLNREFFRTSDVNGFRRFIPTASLICRITNNNNNTIGTIVNNIICFERRVR